MADPQIPEAAVGAFLAAEDAYGRDIHAQGGGRFVAADAARAGLAAAYPVLAEQWRREQPKRALNGIRSRALVDYANRHHVLDELGWCSCDMYAPGDDDQCPERARLFADSLAIARGESGERPDA